LDILKISVGTPYTTKSESSVMTASTTPLAARYASCASASYGATIASTPSGRSSASTDATISGVTVTHR